MLNLFWHRCVGPSSWARGFVAHSSWNRWCRSYPVSYSNITSFLCSYYIFDHINKIWVYNVLVIYRFPDREVGQFPMAYVVKKTGSLLSEKSVMEFVSKQVAPYKRVRKVAFVSSIPKNPSGKILRKDLIKLATSNSKLWNCYESCAVSQSPCIIVTCIVVTLVSSVKYITLRMIYTYIMWRTMLFI